MKFKFVLASLLLAGATAQAQGIDVQNGWVRMTVQGQKATGAFMQITAKDGAQLVGVSSPVAGVVEIHEMKMDGGVMKMQALPVLDLPAGKAVELKPGSYHVMMMDLKTRLVKDSTVPLTLSFKDAKGQTSKLEVKLPILMAPPGSKAGMPQDSAGMHKH